MRLESESAENQLFVGNGTNISEIDNTINIPESIKINSNLDSLIRLIYNNVNIRNICTDQYFKDQIILSSRNIDVDDINFNILNIFLGQKQTYLSSDNIVSEITDNNNSTLYPSEYLNSLKPTGLPPLVLNLKIGCPIILLRNLAP
ncbi:23721_t:CDS:2 [Gigaspora margarita]|uniref:23721_t:CDS:1 n=1 Tax=Gigaspora margarita TaxID=4874 RepID=A0ABN7UPQ7_GIGMA|nr:23721_t:CDS:2 [Gigaspora margarita]